MKRLFTVLGACSLLAIVLVAPSIQAQTAAQMRRSNGPFSYDASKETTINGKISTVIARPAAGMLWGSHLMVETSSGIVDASLGTLAMRGKNAPGFAAGQQVEVTGVMKTIRSQQVFLTRTVKVGNQVYAIRNENGFPVRDTSHDRESHPAGQKGVQP